MVQELVLVIANKNEPRIDSRLVAKSLGIEHESFMRTLAVYQKELEELGLLRFEIGAVKELGARETKYSKSALLNEDQAIFTATSRGRNHSSIFADYSTPLSCR